MPIYNGRTRISDENIWRVVDIKTTTVTSALYENLEENIQEDLQIGDFVLEITEVNQYISDDDILDNKINNINIPNGEIRKTYAVILSKENYNKLQYLTGFTTNTSYSTLGSLRNDINNLKANIVYLIKNNNKYDEYILAGSGNNKELVKIGDTSVTFDSSNLVDLSEFLQLRTDLKQSHDELNNRISSNATNISKNTNNIQNLTNETLSIKNNLNDVEADMTTLTREIWGSDTTTGDSRIDTLEETTQKKERVEIDYLDMGTTTTPDYYNVVNKNGNSFSITYKTSENGASSTIENIKKAPMNVYSAILNGVSYVMQRIIIGDKTYTRYLNVSSNTTSPWMAEPVVTNTVTNTPNKIPTSQAVVDYVPTNISSFNNDSGFITSSSLPTKTSDLTNDGADGTNVFVANNDSRLYDARTPRSHTHGQITDIGKITSSAVTVESDDNIVITDASDTSKLKRVVNLLATHIKDSNAHSNIGTSASATQGAINTAIDTALGGKASSTDLTNGLQNIGGYTIHTVYNVRGSASAYDISSGLLYTQHSPVFFLVKNTIGDNEANATLKYYPNGNNITIIDTFSNTSYPNQPIQQGVWKKDTWALFFCYGNSEAQLRCVFYDSIDIDEIKSNINILGIDNIPYYIVSSVSKDTKRATYNVADTTIYNGNSFYLKVPYYETSTDVRVTINRSSSPIKQGSDYVTESQVNGHLLKLRFNNNVFEVLDIYGDKLVPFFSDLSNVATSGSYNDLSDKPTIVDNLNSTSSTSVLSAKQGKELKTLVDGKQATLVSGTSIKTVNNESLLGSGNINISSGGSNVDIVTAWESELSDNKVASEKLVKNSLDTKYSKNNIVTISSTNTIDLDDYTTSDFYIFAPINMLQYVSNAPSDLDDSVFYLLVERRDNNYAKQILTSKMGVTWVRTKISNIGWNNWKQIIDTDDASTTAPIGNRVNTSATTGSSTKYARADHSHSLTQFKCNGTAGSDGYIKVFQIKINGTYQDSPISFSLMQRGTKQSAVVNIRFANENSNDPALDSFTFTGSNIGHNGEYYLYKESASTWSFIVRKWDTHDVINIYNMSTTNGSVAITSLNTQVSELPSGCIPASMIRNDLFFKTKNGSTSNYINLFEIRPTGDYQSKPITFEIVRNTKPTPVYVSVRLTNVTLASNTYAPQTIYAWGVSDTPVYIRKEADNVFNVIMFHTANEEISVCNMNNPNPTVKITPLGTVYGTDAPSTSGDNKVWTHTYTAGGTTFGTGTNNVVRGNDSRLSDTRNPKSTKISAGSDLNTYTTTGFYYNNVNTDCATITPLPRPNQAFFLQVEDWGTSNYTKQTITHYNPVKTYERIRNAGAWADWHELQHNDGTGGENLLRTEPNNEGNSGVTYTIADETFHNDKVYYRNETSQDTTKYSGWTWAIPRNEFDYGDIFTLSFYAKGTSDAEIRTYFAGASGYISNRRISSNSDVDNNVSSYGDGATRFHLTSDWKRYYVTYQLHTTATTPTQNKSIHIRTLGASTDIEFYISNVKLERGYYATDYDRHTRDNEPLYFPTEVSLPTTTTTEMRRKFIHPPYKFKNVPNWTVEGEIKVTGNAVRFDLHKFGDTTTQNFIAIGKNTGGNLAYWWSTSDSTETSKKYDASHIAVDTWYPFRISRMGNNILFMFNNTDKYEVTTTYFNTIDEVEPTLFRWGTSGASVRNLKITPLEPSIPSKTSQLTDPSAYNNLGTSTDATQSTINTAIDTKIGELETLIGDAITYINGTGGN